MLEALKARFIDQDGLTAQQAGEQQMAKTLRNIRQIVADLLAEDFLCIGEHETDKVLDFARVPESPVLKLA